MMSENIFRKLIDIQKQIEGQKSYMDGTIQIVEHGCEWYILRDALNVIEMSVSKNFYCIKSLQDDVDSIISKVTNNTQKEKGA